MLVCILSIPYPVWVCEAPLQENLPTLQVKILRLPVIATALALPSCHLAEALVGSQARLPLQPPWRAVAPGGRCPAASQQLSVRHSPVPPTSGGRDQPLTRGEGLEEVFHATL